MKKILHLICNSHIDPVWQWDWDEGASAALSTFYAACNLLDKYDFISSIEISLQCSDVFEISSLVRILIIYNTKCHKKQEKNV